MEIESDMESFDKWEDSGTEVKKPLVGKLVAPFAPSKRPPMALLVAFDDGCPSGECIRLRNDRFTIGRTDADFVVPHDEQIASRHVAITRERTEGKVGYRWVIEDLGSETGLLIRIRKSKLRDKSEFLAGNHRYVFNDDASSSDGSKSVIQERLARGSIPGTSIFNEIIAYPSIQRIGDEENATLWLIAGEYWIGRNLDCGLPTPQDPYLADKHVQLLQTDSGWQARTHHIPNGMWIRVKRIDVSQTCTFQIGEQRFRLYTDLASRGA